MKYKRNHFLTSTFVIVLTLLFSSVSQAQTSAFTFQGKLSENGIPANGTYEIQFDLFDASSGGNQIGAAQGNPSVSVIGGIFTVNLDFGAGSFNGPDRFLQISVRPASSQQPFTLLNPRQPVTSAPYAVKSLYSQNAETATTADHAAEADIAVNADNLGGIAANQYVQTNDSRLSDERNPVAGSSYYIQNRQSPQPIANFNISGNGTAATLNVTSHFSFNETNILSAAGADNIFAGSTAGMNNQGYNNSFFGSGAGWQNTTGTQNTFVGKSAGRENTTGSKNSFFGNGAGRLNTDGVVNTFLGEIAGEMNTTGSGNVFVGWRAGDSNTSGSENTVIGVGADVVAGDLTYATAIGAGTLVDSSNTIVLGRSAGTDTVRVPGKFAVNILGSAGSTSLCRNASNQISSCSSSLRYKTNIASFSPGLDLVNRLRPFTFDWKDGGMHDLGLGAEEVAMVEPLLVHYNEKGEVEGVKYDRIGVVLINAVKEQQKQIDLLKQIVCQDHPKAEVCK